MSATRADVGHAIRAKLASRATRGDLLPRLTTLVQVLAPEGSSPATTVDGLLVQASDAMDVHQESQLWLTLAVIAARLPEAADVVAVRRLGELSGARAVIAEAIRRMPGENAGRHVEVATDEVLVDINQLSETPLMTGIQRVAHETVKRWHRDHDVSFVCWSKDYLSMRRTTVTESARALGNLDADDGRGHDGSPLATAVVPWRCHFILPEVALDVPRTRRLQALVRYGGCASAAIGFDLVPLTSSETTMSNVPADFMNGLAAIRHMDRVATISEAARTEYDGWRTMLSSIGVTGPHIRTIALPVDARESSPEQIAATEQRYCVPTLPLVVCVGSHEPRKNHLGVLHAAELLWRDGLEFALVFVGGNAWNSGRFQRRLAELQAEGRLVEATLGLADDTLWALYRLARCTVFPSFNEGFGLPVAESLAAGTPVVTSNFGSMREIGAEGGALLVDPRDDRAIAAAVRTLLTNDLVHARLVREATSRSVRGWEDYARETWDYMVATNPLPNDD